VTSPSSYPQSTLLSVLLSRGEFNDPCNDVSERGDGGLGLIDDCDKNIVDIVGIVGRVVVVVVVDGRAVVVLWD